MQGVSVLPALAASLTPKASHQQIGGGEGAWTMGGDRGPTRLPSVTYWRGKPSQKPLRTFHHDVCRHSARPTDEARDAAAVSFPPFPRARSPLAALGKAAERRMSHGRDDVLWVPYGFPDG